ncbi:MAG: metal-dependent hydrolase [Elusimicrobiota bacterium]
MSPISHLLASWLTAEAAGLERRDRALVTIAGIAADLDGLGYLAEAMTNESAEPLLWYSRWHHVLGHNLAFAVVLGAACAALGASRLRAALTSLLAFHLHLLYDVVGSKGPDGDHLPIAYLYPFSFGWQLEWSGQWELNAWPNVLFAAVLLGLSLFCAWSRARSPVELFSARADGLLTAALRRRWPRPVFTPSKP